MTSHLISREAAKSCMPAWRTASLDAAPKKKYGLPCRAHQPHSPSAACNLPDFSSMVKVSFMGTHRGQQAFSLADVEHAGDPQGANRQRPSLGVMMGATTGSSAVCSVFLDSLWYGAWDSSVMSLEQQ